jgi:hypothetical protein
MSNGEGARQVRATGTRCRQIATASSVFICLLIIGCASAPTASDLALAVSVDRATYRIGDPLVATVYLENKAARAVEAPRFDTHSLKFTYGKKGLNARIRREPVHSRAIAAQARTVEPGGRITRRFLFTRITVEEGEYALLASFKGAVADEAMIEGTVYSKPAGFRVGKEIGLKRDKVNGLILKAQAIDLAKAKAGGDVTYARAVLMDLGKSGLFTWVVMLTETRPNGPVRKHAVQVDAYTGRVKSLELKDKPSMAAAKEKVQTASEEKSRSVSVRSGPEAAPRSKGATAGTNERSPERGGLK